MAEVAGNRGLLRIIVENRPESLDELAKLTGKAKSNLSRTLKMMAHYGIVRLARGERGRVTPMVIHDRVELVLPLSLSRKASLASNYWTFSGTAQHCGVFVQSFEASRRHVYSVFTN